jgi:hypothetical protein
MRVVFAGRVYKPAREDTEIDGAIAESIAALVQRSDRNQQLRNRRPRLGTQEFGLRLNVSFADEPAKQAAPTFTPAGQAQRKRGLLLGFATGCGIASFTLRRHRQQGFHLAVQLCNSVCNGTGAADQVADKTLQIIDQPLLECDDRLYIRLLEFDRAGDAGHESLSIVGQPHKDAHEIA